MVLAFIVDALGVTVVLAFGVLVCAAVLGCNSLGVASCGVVVVLAFGVLLQLLCFFCM